MKKLYFLILLLGSQILPGQSMESDTLTTSSGLKVYFKKPCLSSVEKPQNGDKIKVHYKGMFEDGQVFESSYDFGAPFKFQLGKKEVIPGWDEAFLLICEGQKAFLIVPSHLAYGTKGLKHPEKKEEYLIPPSKTLFYEVELVKIIPNKKK